MVSFVLRIEMLVARLKSLALLVLLLVGIGTPSTVGYLCSMTGEVSRDHCCQEDTPPIARIAADHQCCSAVEASQELPPILRIELTPSEPPVVVAEVLDPFTSIPDSPANVELRIDRPPPPHKHPIFTRHCAFLI